MRFQWRWLSAAAVALALSATAAPAFAQTGSAQTSGSASGTGKAAGTQGARELYASGEAKYKAGDFPGALSDFQAADAIKPASQAARYIGLCQDKLGHLPEAVVAYERFLSNVPPKLQGEVDGIKRRVDEIKAMKGHLHVELNPAGATLLVDGKPQPGASPIDVDLPPGPHTLHASADGRDPVDQTVTVTFAGTQNVSLRLPEKAAAVVAVVPVPEPAPVAPPPPPAEPRSKIPALITGGLAIVAAGVGTAFGIVTLNDKSNFNKTPTESIAETGQNHALVADMSFGIAITLGVTSAVLFLTRDETDPQKPKASLTTVKLAHTGRGKEHDAPTLTATPFVTAHGGGAGALFSF